MLNAFIDRCCSAISLLIALALAVMVVMVFGNVVLRSVVSGLFRADK